MRGLTIVLGFFMGRSGSAFPPGGFAIPGRAIGLAIGRLGLAPGILFASIELAPLLTIGRRILDIFILLHRPLLGLGVVRSLAGVFGVTGTLETHRTLFLF